MIRTWPIDESLEGERCDVALSRLTGESRATCVTLLEDKRVTLNGKVAQKSARLAFGDVVEVSESSELPNALSSSDYLLVFAPPHEVPRKYLSAAIPVFAWEYSTIPNEKLNDNDL